LIEDADDTDRISSEIGMSGSALAPLYMNVRCQASHK